MAVVDVVGPSFGISGAVATDCGAKQLAGADSGEPKRFDVCVVGCVANDRGRDHVADGWRKLEAVT